MTLPQLIQRLRARLEDYHRSSQHRVITERFEQIPEYREYMRKL